MGLSLEASIISERAINQVEKSFRLAWYIMDSSDTDGLSLEFGSAEALCKSIELTGRGEGLGRLLGLGARRLCERYGHPEIAMHVKGQEFAGYDARAMPGMGLGYATGNRGACHMKHDVFRQDMQDQSATGKAGPCRESQDRIAMIDSSGLCVFPTNVGWTLEDYRRLLNPACGMDWSQQDLMRIGERIWTLERLFNQRAGFTGADDTLPERLLKTPAPTGTARGRVCELQPMLAEYYALRGWNPDGSLPEALVERLAL